MENRQEAKPNDSYGAGFYKAVSNQRIQNVAKRASVIMRRVSMAIPTFSSDFMPLSTVSYHCI